jgi:hypothetical protein
MGSGVGSPPWPPGRPIHPRGSEGEIEVLVGGVCGSQARAGCVCSRKMAKAILRPQAAPGHIRKTEYDGLGMISMHGVEGYRADRAIRTS